MMVGLQGSGKTTTSAKLAKRLTERDRKRVLMASLDVARPAAQEQLAVLGRQIVRRHASSRSWPAAGRHREAGAHDVGASSAGRMTSSCSTTAGRPSTSTIS